MSEGVLILDDGPDNESDYTLREDAVGCWITIGNLSVHPIRTDEGVVVDIYPAHQEYKEPLASTYAFFDEAEESEEEEE